MPEPSKPVQEAIQLASCLECSKELIFLEALQRKHTLLSLSCDLVQTILKETLTDDKEDWATQMVGEMLQVYTQALCAAAQPALVAPAATQAAPAVEAG